MDNWDNIKDAQTLPSLPPPLFILCSSSELEILLLPFVLGKWLKNLSHQWQVLLPEQKMSQR